MLVVKANPVGQQKFSSFFKFWQNPIRSYAPFSLPSLMAKTSLARKSLMPFFL